MGTVTDPNGLDVAGELALAHAELSRRQSFTDALLETIDVGIVSCDADGNFVVSNRAQRELFGFQSGLHGRWMGDLDPHIDVFDEQGTRLTSERYPLMRTLRGTLHEPLRVRVGPAGGPYRELVVRGTQIHDAGGEVIGAVAALTDVTELTLAEQSATRANSFLEAVLTAGAAEQLVHPDDRKRLRTHDNAAAELADGSVFQIRYRGIHPDGGWRWLHRRSTPFRRDESGRVVEVVAVVRDISDVVDAENLLTHGPSTTASPGCPTAVCSWTASPPRSPGRSTTGARSPCCTSTSTGSGSSTTRPGTPPATPSCWRLRGSSARFDRATRWPAWVGTSS